MVSPFLNTGTDGADPGVHWANLQREQAVARSGDRRSATRTLWTGTIGTCAAAYPTVYNSLTFPTRTGSIRNVTAGSASSLQTQINAAAPGDWIIVPAGVANKYATGGLTFPAKTGADQTPGGNAVVVIMSKAVYDSIDVFTGKPTVLPEGVRVVSANQATRLGGALSATDTEKFFHVQGFGTGTAGAVFDTTTAAAHGYRIVGAYATPDPALHSTTPISRIFRLGTGNSTQNTDAQTPKNWVLDRCLIGPSHASQQISHAIDFQVGNSVVIDCDVSGIWENGNGDCQACLTYNSNGQNSFINTYFEASDEGFSTGGGDNNVGSLKNMEMRWCVFGKQDSWNPSHPSYDGQPRSVKLSAEVKEGQNLLFAGCLYIGCWFGTQQADGLNIKHNYTEVGTNRTQDVIVRDCSFEKLGTGIRIAGGADDTVGIGKYSIHRTTVFNCLGVEIGGGYYDPTNQAGRWMQTNNVEGLSVIHCTAFATNVVHYFVPGATDSDGYNGLTNGLDHTNCVYGGPVGFAYFRGGGTGDGKPTLDTWAPGALIHGTVIAGATSGNYTGTNLSGNSFPSNNAAIQFTNYTGTNAGDYSLSGTTQTAGGTPSVATSLHLAASPTSAASGVPLTPSPVVTVLDQFGAPMSSSATVTAAVGSGTGTVTAGATAVESGTIGATFSGLTITAAVTGPHTLVFTSPGLTSATTSSFTVTGTPVATSLVLDVPPSGGVSGTALPTQPVARVVDQFGASIVYAATVTAAVTSGHATVSAGGTKAAPAGVATFTGLTLTTATAGTNTVTFSAPGLTVATAAVSVSLPAGPVDPPPTTQPISLAIARLPGGASTGKPFTTQPIIEARNASGALLTSFTGYITAYVVSGPGVLRGTTRIKCVGGVARFTNLGINGSGDTSIAFTDGTPP